MQIRKGIKNFYFDLLKNFYNNYNMYYQDYFYSQSSFILNNNSISMKTRNKKNLKKEDKNFITFLFDDKLENLLGKKICRDEKEVLLPKFLINKKENLDKYYKEENMIIECNVNYIKINKKLFRNDKKILNFDFKNKKKINNVEINNNNKVENNNYNIIISESDESENNSNKSKAVTNSNTNKSKSKDNNIIKNNKTKNNKNNNNNNNKNSNNDNIENPLTITILLDE